MRKTLRAFLARTRAPYYSGLKLHGLYILSYKVCCACTFSYYLL